MKFLNVQAKNFMSFKELDFVFPQNGLYFVGGEVTGGVSNSNGAGKSSLFEAWCFGLFGRTIRNVSKDEIVNWNVKKECSVEVILEDDVGDAYIVSRYRNHSEGGNAVTLFKGNKDITGTDVKVTQEVLDGILGMNWLVFSTAVIFGEKARRFAEASEAEKKEIFDEILMLHHYKEAQGMVKNDLRELKDKKGRIEFSLGGAKSGLEAVKNELVSVEGELEKVGEQKKVVGKQVNEKELELDSLLEAKKKGTEEAEVAKKAYDELEVENKKLYSFVTEVKKEEGEEMDTLSQSTRQAWMELLPVTTKIEELDKRIAGAKDAPKGERCPSCGQEVNEQSVEMVVKHYQDELGELCKALEPLEFKHKAAEDVYKIAGEKWVKKIENAEEAHVELEIELTNQRGIVTKKTEEVRKVENDILLIRKDIDHLKAAHEEVEQRLVETITRLKVKIDHTGVEIKDYTNSIIEIEEGTKYLDFLVEAFSNRGIKSLLLDEIIPSLNTRVNYNASALLEDEKRIEFDTEAMLKSGESRDKFNVKLYVGNEEVNYKSCSSGEKRRIDICILLSLQGLIFSRSASNSNIIIFDEIFDSLDIVGIEKVVNLLQEEAKDKTIFVISHSSEFRDYFENEIMVKKENGVSHLVV